MQGPPGISPSEMLYYATFRLSFIVSLLRCVQAVSFYTNSTVPGNLTSACTSALLADVNCDPVVPALLSGDFYPSSTLSRACTSNCANALSSFQSHVQTACSNDVWLGYNNETMPVVMIPELQRYHYNLTCLSYNGQFCNNVGAAYAAHLDPNSTGNNGKPYHLLRGLSRTDRIQAPANGQYGSITVTDPCNRCLIMNLQFQAGSPYYDGPDLWTSSLYQSKTSSCSVTDMPLTSTDLTLFTWVNVIVSMSCLLTITQTDKYRGSCQRNLYRQSVQCQVRRRLPLDL